MRSGLALCAGAIADDLCCSLGSTGVRRSSGGGDWKVEDEGGGRKAKERWRDYSSQHAPGGAGIYLLFLDLILPAVWQLVHNAIRKCFSQRGVEELEWRSQTQEPVGFFTKSRLPVSALLPLVCSICLRQ